MYAVVQAVFENGVFRPTGPVPHFANGTAVELTVLAPVEQKPGEPTARRSKKEVMELIRSKPPKLDIPDAMWDEMSRALEIAMSNVRDSEVMRQAAEDMDRLREQREGMLDIVMPLLRESRDGE